MYRYIVSISWLTSPTCIRADLSKNTCHVSYEEEDTCTSCVTWGGGGGPKQEHLLIGKTSEAYKSQWCTEIKDIIIKRDCVVYWYSIQ